MTTLVDRTTELGNAGVMHALVVGVSDYRYLPSRDEPPNPTLYKMFKLDAPVRSAAKVIDWLWSRRDGFDRKLASIEAVLSPAPAENAEVAAIVGRFPDCGGLIERADIAGLSRACHAWRRLASLRKDNATLFYFAGHGMERIGGQILPLEDYGEENFGVFTRTVMFQNIFEGMAPSVEYPDIGKTQFYFLDACRTRLTDQIGMKTTATTIFDSTATDDDRVAPVYYASAPDDIALAEPGGVTKFSRVLLNALETAATHKAIGAGGWQVDSLSILDAINRRSPEMSPSKLMPAGGNFAKAVLHWLPHPPMINFKVSLSPEPVVETTKVVFQSPAHGIDLSFDKATGQHPYDASLPCGIYRVQANPNRPDFLIFDDFQNIDYKIGSMPIRLEAAI